MTIQIEQISPTKLWIHDGNEDVMLIDTAGAALTASFAELNALDGGGLNLSSGTPASHAINLESLTLPANTNAIRGASVNPTRASGWISFSGTVSTSPAAVYSDYRELHTTGTAEVLGMGSFPYMDSGASCKSLYGCQFIVTASSGSTIAAATGAADGVFALYGKTLVDGATVNASGVMAAAFLSFQANVTDVAALDSSMVNMEIASGGIRSVFKIQDSASGGATFLLDFTDDLGKPCSLTNGSDLNDISATANQGWIKVRIGSTTRYIPLYAAKA